jgi:hypothetical protein
VLAVEIDAFAQYPEAAQALEAQLVAKGWTPPGRQLPPEPIDPLSLDDIPERAEQNDCPPGRADGDECAEPTSTAQLAEGTPPAAREPELPPGTVRARVPPTQPGPRTSS